MPNSGRFTETLISYLVTGVDGHRFEAVVQSLLEIRDGSKFVPLGGVHDGGADGLYRSTLEDTGRPRHFIQISKQENASAKIRETFKQLRKVGREVKAITYWTGVRIPTLDTLEEDLSKDLGVTVRIRDQAALLQLINHSQRTREAFENAFRAEIFDLSAHAANLAATPEDFAADPSVFVFLQFETKERTGKGGLVTPVVDALIYWSLRDTNPDRDLFATRAQIKDRISSLFPGAAANLLPSVDGRLKGLSAKSGTGQQRIRHHRQGDSFCLPYEMRVQLAEASAGERQLHDDLRKSLTDRAAAANARKPAIIAEVCERAIYKHFLEQGLILAVRGSLKSSPNLR